MHVKYSDHGHAFDYYLIRLDYNSHQSNNKKQQLSMIIRLSFNN